MAGATLQPHCASGIYEFMDASTSFRAVKFPDVMRIALLRFGRKLRSRGPRLSHNMRVAVRIMNTIKASVSTLARGLTARQGVSRLLAALNGRGRIIMLHGLGTPQYPAEVFRAQLRFIARAFRIVSLEQLLATETTGRDSRPKLALTFDDGLRNNLTVVYPILREFRVAATFFVCPGLVETGRWPWNFECRARLRRMSLDQRSAIAGELSLESSDIEGIVTKLKDLPHGERVAVERRLCRATPDFTPTDGERLEYDVMTWKELKSLDPAVVTVGAHSSHHEILTRLEPEQLEREIAGCKVWLERELGRPVRHFCYPDGAYDARVLECVARHFDTAVTTERDWVPRRPSLFELPRIPTAPNVRDLAWRVHRPTG